MNSTRACGFIARTVLAVVMFTAAPLLAQNPANDPIAEHFYLPELIIRTHEIIGLTPEQKQELKSEYEDAQQLIAPIKETIEKERQAMEALVKNPKVDEKAALDQAEKVLNAESDLKRAQLKLLIRIKNKLTPEQQARLNDLKAKYTGIQSKMRQAQELAQQWKAQGRDLSSLEAKRDQFDQLMKEGKVEDAEKLLDEALKTLAEKK